MRSTCGFSNFLNTFRIFNREKNWGFSFVCPFQSLFLYLYIYLVHCSKYLLKQFVAAAAIQNFRRIFLFSVCWFFRLHRKFVHCIWVLMERCCFFFLVCGSCHQNPIKPLFSGWLNHVSNSGYVFFSLSQLPLCTQQSENRKWEKKLNQIWCFIGRFFFFFYFVPRTRFECVGKSEFCDW